LFPLEKWDQTTVAWQTGFWGVGLGGGLLQTLASERCHSAACRL